MKIKLICAAAAAVIAVSTAVVATAYGNSANNNEVPGASAEPPFVISDMETRDIESTGEDEKTSENDKADTDPVSDQEVFDEKASVDDKAPTITENKSSISFKAVNAINSEITYAGEFDENSMNIRLFDGSDHYYYQVDDSNTSLGYLKKYFNSDIFPVDEIYKDNLLCYFHGGVLEFDVAQGTEAKSPVDGKVISVSVDKYNGGRGNTVAVEFGNKIFTMTHLDSISVKAGDEITAGQTLGVCGNSGMVMYNKTQLGMVLMEKQ